MCVNRWRKCLWLLLGLAMLLQLVPVSGMGAAARAEGVDTYASKQISLGVDALLNPKYGNGSQSAVWFGSGTGENKYDYPDYNITNPDYSLQHIGEPLLFDVLNTNETAFSSSNEPTLLLLAHDVLFQRTIRRRLTSVCRGTDLMVTKMSSTNC